jgi:hypothetical protein
MIVGEEYLGESRQAVHSRDTNYSPHSSLQELKSEAWEIKKIIRRLDLDVWYGDRVEGDSGAELRREVTRTRQFPDTVALDTRAYSDDECACGRESTMCG